MRILATVAISFAACQGVPDERARPLDVTGHDSFVTAAGTETRPLPLEALRAYGAHGGAWVELEVTLGEPGTARVERAVPGPVYLRWRGDWIATAGDSVDLGEHQLGRPDAARPDQSIELGLELGGLEPWGEADQIQLYSPGAGAWLFAVPDGTEPEATAIDASLGYAEPLVDAGRGDRLWVAQMKARETAGESYLALATAARLADVEMATSPVARADLAAAPARPFEVDWRIGAFDAERLRAQPVVASAWYDANLAALDGADTRGQYGLAADLVTMRVTGRAGRDVAGRFESADPFPDGWQRMATFIAWYPVRVSAAPGDVPATVFDAIWIRDRADALDGAPAEPRVGAPAHVDVDGRAVRWSPPDLGVPTGYQVTVFSLASEGGLSRVTAEVDLYTALRAVEIPPGAIARGADAFAVRVAAVAGPDLAVRPRALSLPYAWASRISTVQTP